MIALLDENQIWFDIFCSTWITLLQIILWLRALDILSINMYSRSFWLEILEDMYFMRQDRSL